MVYQRNQQIGLLFSTEPTAGKLPGVFACSASFRKGQAGAIGGCGWLLRPSEGCQERPPSREGGCGSHVPRELSSFLLVQRPKRGHTAKLLCLHLQVDGKVAARSCLCTTGAAAPSRSAPLCKGSAATALLLLQPLYIWIPTKRFAMSHNGVM